MIAITEREEITVSEYNVNSIPRNKSNHDDINVMKETGKYIENLIGEQIKKLYPKTLIENTKKIKESDNDQFCNLYDDVISYFKIIDIYNFMHDY